VTSVPGRVRIAVSEVQPGAWVLDPSASRHLAVVLRLSAGDSFVAFDPKHGIETDGRVVRVHRGTVHAEFGEMRAASAVAALPITWIQGLAKGEKMDAIVRDATELGATQFVPARTAFSVVVLEATRAEARRRRWSRIAEQAARQCGRADPPAIEAPCAWTHALHAAHTAPARFCLFEGATEPLGPLLSRALTNRVALGFAAGPEGGLAPSEVASAIEAGYAVVSLGALTLRTETVATAVLGAVRVFLSG
jgi:16S rRNA (uracil1498-N3)-methyltransferase